MTQLEQSSTPKVSIVIRVRNEARALDEVFQALAAQRASFAYEIVVVDNDSEDDTRSVAKAFGARIVNIPKDEFTYGRALNIGLKAARGELCLLLSAHALPVGSDFLAKAVAPFDDAAVAAARCICSSNEQQMANWHRPTLIHYSSIEEQQAMERGRRWTAYYPAATCAVIRKSVFEEIPFNEKLEGTEDKVWASAAAKKGYKLVACAEAVFVYRRKFSRKEQFDKRYREHLALYRFNGYLAVTWPEFLLELARNIGAIPKMVVSEIYHRTRFKWNLMKIPGRAQRAAKTGSLAEFMHNRR